MTYYALLFARTLTDADSSAVDDWKWERAGELHNEYRRPDTGERARWVPDDPNALQNLRWGTRVYLGHDWERRNDAGRISVALESGFFNKIDPQLPPPRPRVTRDDKISEIRRQLARLEQGK